MNQIEKVARDIAQNLGPFTMKLLREENYSGEHREWYEEIIIPRDADIVREITQAAIAAMPVQAEPVAWMYQRDDGSRDLLLDCNGEYARNLIELGATETPLYALPIPTPPAGGSDAE